MEPARSAGSTLPPTWFCAAKRSEQLAKEDEAAENRTHTFYMILRGEAAENRTHSLIVCQQARLSRKGHRGFQELFSHLSLPGGAKRVLALL